MNINIQENGKHKQEISVLVVLGKGKHVAKKKGDTTVGLLYDIWGKMKERLSREYTFLETFKEYSNYDEMVKMVSENKYDVVVGPFQYTEDRLKIVDYTSPIILSKNTILYFPQQTSLSTFFTVSKYILEPVLILILLGICFGVLVYLFDIGRTKFYTGSMKKYPFRRILLTSIAAMFGELGFMSENSSLNYVSLLLVLLIMIISFFMVTYIQGVIIKKIIDIQNKDQINRDNVKDRILLCPAGYAVSKNFERIGARIKYVDGTVDDTIREYLKNTYKYIGVSLDYMDAIGRESTNLKVNKENFGFVEVAFVVNKNKRDLKHKINIEILKLQDSLVVEHVCKSYIDKEDTQLCII